MQSIVLKILFLRSRESDLRLLGTVNYRGFPYFHFNGSWRTKLIIWYIDAKLPPMSAVSIKKLNSFLFLKVPAAWLCGVRIKEIGNNRCVVGVRHRWINQNPFNSMYFAVQAMAAELSTGALVMTSVQESGQRISMLVKSNEAVFTKKARGKIRFECKDGQKVAQGMKAALASDQGQTFWMESVGTDQSGEEVSRFRFEWSLKKRSN